MKEKCFSLFALLIAMILMLSACAGDTPAPAPAQEEEPGNSLEAVQKLLTRDYIVGYLWYCDGLPE